MLRRTPMTRRNAPEARATQRAAERAATLAAPFTATLRPLHTARMGRCDGVAAAVPKDDTVTSEPYRRLVAAMPCKACGIEGYSQAAHVPPDGKGIKQDDRLTFALCCVRPGIPGCHQDFDQYRMFSSAEARIVGRMWAAETRQSIEAAGTWPANLPKWTEA